MLRLIWGFAGGTNHIVGNLMSRLNSYQYEYFVLYSETDKWISLVRNPVQTCQLIVASICPPLSSDATIWYEASLPAMKKKCIWKCCLLKLSAACICLHQGLIGSSVVECLTQDRGAAGSNLTGVAGLCLWARHINPSLVPVQARKTHPFMGR